MSVFKDFPGLENLEKNQGLSRTRKSPAYTSSLLSAFGLEFQYFSQDKFLAKPMGSVSKNNCCKWFRFKEKVEKQ